MKAVIRLLILSVAFFSFGAKAFDRVELNNFVDQLTAKITESEGKKLSVSLKNTSWDYIIHRSDELKYDSNLKEETIRILDSSVSLFRNVYDPTVVYVVIPDSGFAEGNPAFGEFKVKANKVKFTLYTNAREALKQFKF